MDVAVASNDGVYRGPFPGQQMKFCQATQREVFFGGAGGGGKSVNGKGKFLQQLSVENRRFEAGEIERSKCWGIYFRRTMPDLKQAIDKSYQIFQDFDHDAYYNINDHVWTFPNCADAHFEFAHMENENTKYKYKSREFTYAFFDELTEFSESMYDYIDTRIRTTDPVLEPMLQLCSASNPDGPGLLWVRKRFIEDKEPEVIYRKETRLRDGRLRYYDSVFIPASLKDNPILYQSGQYEASLLNKRPEVRRAILEGDWWINPGAFLANSWDRSVHVVPNHDIPRGCRVYRSCDPGIASPTSVTWYYEDRNGGFTAIHNLYLRNHDAAMMAARIKEVEEYYGWWDEDANQSTLDGWMDEDAFNRNLVGGPSYAKIHRDAGIRWRKGRKDRSSRFNGASEIVRRLQARVKDIDGQTKPLLRWMERCKAPIETLPVLQTDPNDPNDVDTKGEDHCWDDLMYLCLARTLPKLGEKQDNDDDDIIDIEEYRNRYKGTGAMGVPPGGW